MTKKAAAKSIDDLVSLGLVHEDRRAVMGSLASRYSVGISQHILEIIETTGATGPVARQYVPSSEEMRIRPTDLADPIGDETYTPVRGIVHRYPDRVLLKPVHVCPVYCRFCFRREAVGAGGEVLTPEQTKQALDYIREHDEIWEVILSGGDPLVLSDRKLASIIEQLNAIRHVEVIRIHSRYPVAEPSRVTPELVAALCSSAALYIVLHCNHVDELTPDVTAACNSLTDAGIPLLSQSVLLADVNDSADSLEQLLRGLVARRIKPYYLHQLDFAPGTGHFRVSVHEGQTLMRDLRGRMSGLCHPLYVLDIPGGYGKVPIGPCYIEDFDDESATYQLKDCHGRDHRYVDATKGE